MVKYKDLPASHNAYKEISELITNRSIVVENIVEVQNWHLQRKYDWAKQQKRQEFENVKEVLLFHGTSAANVDSICTNNFDWRLYGSNRGHKYGMGVSFSSNAKYASNYSDPSYHKVMVVARVLVGKTCQGHKAMERPPCGFDTSVNNENWTVCVKYDDNDYYPAYILHYHLKEEYSSGSSGYEYHGNCYHDATNYHDGYDYGNQFDRNWVWHDYSYGNFWDYRYDPYYHRGWNHTYDHNNGEIRYRDWDYRGRYGSY